ncbi:reverse transcriptase domain-containing protein [Tanacetum coccineum]|uniref:Reverse transcriptase domain-containing protein n=1 Tax=Tanacetum coccineum TaxID=301880 RepID=A0ABQ5AID9_9ASTR
MQSQREIEYSGVSPSFSCYSSENLTSKAVAKVIQEQLAEHFNELGVINEDDFEFSFEEVISSHKDMDSKSGPVFPIFSRDLDSEVISKDEKIDVSVSIITPLRKLFIDEEFVSSSYSLSESEEANSDNELENIPSETFCVWRPKTESGSSSPAMTKCKKSSSTGSGSKRWCIRYLLKRSNSEGEQQPKVSLISKQKRSSGEVSKDVARLKGKTPAHELFYVQRRAENEIVKRKSFLPYRQDLVGLFGNVNRTGKMPPF